MTVYYFVGKYADVGHRDKAAGVEKGRGYPVFSTYNKDDKNQKHANAWFVFEVDAINWANYKNAQQPKFKEKKVAPYKVRGDRFPEHYAFMRRSDKALDEL